MKATGILKDFSKSIWIAQQATGIIKLMTEIEETRNELRKLIGVDKENQFWKNIVTEAEKHPINTHDFIIAKYKSEITKLQHE